MNAPNMSHTVELLYPERAQVRAVPAGWKPGCNSSCGLNSTRRPSTVTAVMPITATAAPGNGSRTRPTITPAKIEKKYHAWGARPEGTGNKARTIAIATGASAFHIEVAGVASGRLLGVATDPLGGAACVTLPIAVLETPIFPSSKTKSIDSVSIPDIEPPCPIIKVAAGRSLF